jgi:hypothetical protein
MLTFFKLEEFLNMAIRLFDELGPGVHPYPNGDPLSSIPGALHYTNYNSDEDKNYESLRTPREDINITMIPYWVNESLSGIQYDYMRILKYKEARHYLTEEEMISLLCLENLYVSSTANLIESNYLLNQWQSSKGEEGFDADYYRRIADQYLPIVLNRLDQSGASSECPSGYKIINEASGIFIIVYSNFFKALAEKNNRLDFFRDLLKTIYMKAPLHEVCLSSGKVTANGSINNEVPKIFNGYLALLR